MDERLRPDLSDGCGHCGSELRPDGGCDRCEIAALGDRLFGCGFVLALLGLAIAVVSGIKILG